MSLLLFSCSRRGTSRIFNGVLASSSSACNSSCCSSSSLSPPSSSSSASSYASSSPSSSARRKSSSSSCCISTKPASLHEFKSWFSSTSALDASTPSPSSPFSASCSSSPRVVLFGSDDISVATLNELITLSAISSSSSSSSSSPSPSIVVVCPPYRRLGRGKKKPLPLFARAQELRLPIIRVEEEVDFRMKNFHLPDWIFDSSSPPPSSPSSSTAPLSSSSSSSSPSSSSSFSFSSPSCPSSVIGVVVSFGYFLPSRIVSRFTLGCINLHPSLLPLLRGASPIQHALLLQQKKTGVSILEVEASSLDSGALLLQQEEEIVPTDTFKTLSDRLAKKGAICMKKIVEMILSSSSSSSYFSSSSSAISSSSRVTILPRIPQRSLSAEEAHLAKARLLSSSFSHLDFTKSSAEVFARFRAGFGYMNMRTVFRGQNVIVLDMAMDIDREPERSTWSTPYGTQTMQIEVKYSNPLDSMPGSFAYSFITQRLHVRCGDNHIVTIGMLHLENKMKPVDARTFYFGHLASKIAARESLRFEQVRDEQDDKQKIDVEEKNKDKRMLEM